MTLFVDSPMSMKKHVLLTGEPGVGKTTICKMLIEHFKNEENISGFYTEEVRGTDSKSGRVGFDVVSIDDLTLRFPLARLSSMCPQLHGPRVSKYTIDLEKFEASTVPLLKKSFADTSLCVIDEIGKMELFSPRFKSLVIDLFDRTSVNLLCTVPSYQIKFVDDLKRRDDVELFHVTKCNRNYLKSELIQRIEAYLCQTKEVMKKH